MDLLYQKLATIAHRNVTYLYFLLMRLLRLALRCCRCLAFVVEAISSYQPSVVSSVLLVASATEEASPSSYRSTSAFS